MSQSKVPCTRACGRFLNRDNRSGVCQACQRVRPAGVDAPSSVETDRTQRKEQGALGDLQRKYKEALDLIDRLQLESAVQAKVIAGLDDTIKIEPRDGSGTSEATPVIVASDWHAEEIVTPAQVSGLNVANLDVIDKRITRFFQSSLNLIKNHLNPGVQIHDVILALLGDFITNDIHEELVENVALKPVEAIIWAQDRLFAGINFLLNNSPYTFTIPCRVGNHSRTTKKTYFSQENGHSLEHMMYVSLKLAFRNEPRVRFVIQDGYHLFLDVYGTTIRFHHGHAIKYGGGVGGIFIPTFKAISQWNKARPADLDVFGHFHQTKDGGNFLCNGSLIGYNAFAVAIKADYERPQQTLILVDKKRGLTCRWPILL